MTILGISCGFHDAAISVVGDGEILFAAHAERYSRVKNDRILNQDLVNACLEFGKVDEIIYFEKPWLKNIRRVLMGQRVCGRISPYFKQLFGNVPIHTVEHHEAHAAAGYYTCPWEDDVSVIVVDAIGEFDTMTVWVPTGGVLEKKVSVEYPNSIGLLYSAFTERCGFKANEEEYIMMALGDYGTPKYVADIKKTFIDYSDPVDFILKRNVHFGIQNWMPDAKTEDLAASIQYILEEYLLSLFEWVRYTTNTHKVVYMGGVALNCVANAKLAQDKIFDDIWIMPNPGDAGSSLGAALAYTKKKVKWNSPFLGTNIDRDIDFDSAVDVLLSGKPIGIANGRAEFGPRALGNRSILLDPRIRNGKYILNTIKNRETFRPFGASILEKEWKSWYSVPKHVDNSPYMQYSWRVKNPRMIHGACHINSTTRLQTVSDSSETQLYQLLLKWYDATGCPILLNTSMNIKGHPLVDNWKEAMKFSKQYNVEIF